MVFTFSFRVLVTAVVLSVVSLLYSYLSFDVVSYSQLYFLTILLFGAGALLYFRQFDPEINKTATLTDNETIIEVSRILTFGMMFSTVTFFIGGVGILVYLMFGGYAVARILKIEEEGLEFHDRLIKQYILETLLLSGGLIIALFIIYLTPVGVILSNFAIFDPLYTFLASLLLPLIYLRSIWKFREMISIYQQGSDAVATE